MNYKNKFPGYFIYLYLLLMFSSCDIVNPPEPIPRRIQLNPVMMEVQSGQGSARHKITELWTFADSNFLGAFSPPVIVNYHTDEEVTNLILRAGIRNNGILDAAIVYPVFAQYEIDVPTSPGMISVVNPVFRYRTDAVFSLVSDFETQNDFVDNRDTVSASSLVRSDTDPYEGNFSGEIILTEEAYLIEVSHAIGLANLPTDGTPAYLELHYKSEVDMFIGILGVALNGQEFDNYFYLLKPSGVWNKIYIELTPRLVESDFPAYKILFSAAYPSEGTQPSYKIQLDNIKVVHL